MMERLISSPDLKLWLVTDRGARFGPKICPVVKFNPQLRSVLWYHTTDPLQLSESLATPIVPLKTPDVEFITKVKVEQFLAWTLHSQKPVEFSCSAIKVRFCNYGLFHSFELSNWSSISCWSMRSQHDGCLSISLSSSKWVSRTWSFGEVNDLMWLRAKNLSINSFKNISLQD